MLAAVVGGVGSIPTVSIKMGPLVAWSGVSPDGKLPSKLIGVGTSV